MSVITTHELTFPDAKRRLLEAGAIKPDTLHGRGGTEHAFQNVLDIRACDGELADRLREHYREKGWLELSQEGQEPSGAKYERRDYTEAELDELLKVPVYFSKDGNSVLWDVNYGTDGNPAAAIGKLFPDEIMAYGTDTEGRSNGSCWVKNGRTVNSAGKPIEAMLYGVTVKEIPGNGKQVKAYLPVDNTDRRFALVYADREDIQDRDIGSPGGKKDLAVKSLDAKTYVYRCLADGSRTRKAMSFRELQGRVLAAKAEYAEGTPKRKKAPEAAGKGARAADKAPKGARFVLQNVLPAGKGKGYMAQISFANDLPQKDGSYLSSVACTNVPYEKDGKQGTGHLQYYPKEQIEAINATANKGGDKPVFRARFFRRDGQVVVDARHLYPEPVPFDKKAHKANTRTAKEARNAEKQPAGPMTPAQPAPEARPQAEAQDGIQIQ